MDEKVQAARAAYRYALEEDEFNNDGSRPKERRLYSFEVGTEVAVRGVIVQHLDGLGPELVTVALIGARGYSETVNVSAFLTATTWDEQVSD